MSTYEIELRYEILDSSQIHEFVIPLKYLHTKRDVDLYFDNPQAELYQRGIFIRIRNDKNLDIKFNRACLENPELAIQDYCEEYSFALPLHKNDLERLNNVLISLALLPLHEASLECLKHTNNFDAYYVVDKKRMTYSYDDLTVCVDEVADLGSFLEIEYMAVSTEKIESIKNQMQKLLGNLSVKPLKTGYGTLLLRKNHFQEYLRGRFILPEDKINIYHTS